MPLLIGSGALLIFAAFLTAYLLRYQLQLFIAVDPAFQLSLVSYLPLVLLLVVFMLFSFRFSLVYPYQPGPGLGRRNMADRHCFHDRRHSPDRGQPDLPVDAVQPPCFLVYGHTCHRLSGRQPPCDHDGAAICASTTSACGNVLLIGAGDVGRMVMRTLAARPDYGLKLVGFLDDNPAKSSTDVGALRRSVRWKRRRR